MKLNRLYAAFVAVSLLLPHMSPLLGISLPVTIPHPLTITINQQPESALSLAVADFVSFFTSGFKSVFKPLFVMHDREKALLDTGLASDQVKALHSAAFRGILIAIPPLTGILLLGGSKIGLKILKRNLLNPKPAILNKKQHPLSGRIDRIKQWWSGRTLQTMIFSDDIQKRLTEIEKKTIMLRNLIKMGKKRTYANLLLHGAPGTGKTLFAQQLAHKTNMDFLPVTAASLLQKGIEGIKYFDELIDAANRSAYGTIIFIDEADGLFVDRNALSPDSDHYKILEHILTIIDGRSDKFMVIAATNRAHMFDTAMNRRFQDQIEMPLPDDVTRKKIVELYIAQILYNEKETSAQFVRAARRLFVTELITQIVEKTAGLSPAEIADMVEAMRNKAELYKRVIKMVDVESAVDQAMAKHRHNTKK